MYRPDKMYAFPQTITQIVQSPQTVSAEMKTNKLAYLVVVAPLMLRNTQYPSMLKTQNLMLRKTQLKFLQSVHAAA